jgi:hypothetical protein
MILFVLSVTLECLLELGEVYAQFGSGDPQAVGPSSPVKAAGALVDVIN